MKDNDSALDCTGNGAWMGNIVVEYTALRIRQKTNPATPQS